MQFNFLAGPNILLLEKPAQTTTLAKTYNSWDILLWVLIAQGIFFRLFHFFDNRSLWIDEIYLSTSILEMNFWELASPPLHFEQKAPIGYLWMSKLAVLLFGSNEFALRLFPLLCGIASLFVFLPVSRHFLKPLGAVVALGILALAPPLIYHSVEAKQYSTELLATALVLFLYTRYYRRYDLRSLVLWGASGAAILWFSFSSIFVLAGMAIGLCLYHMLRREWKKFFLLFIPFTMWLLSFVISYVLCTSKQTDSEWLIYWFSLRDGFLAFPPKSMADLTLPLQVAGTRLMNYPLGLLWNVDAIDNSLLQYLIRRPILPILCALMGLYTFFRNDRRVLYILLLPLLLTVVASITRHYPLYERLMVFQAPLLILAIAQGCNELTAIVSPWVRKAKYALPALLLAAPLWSSAQQVADTHLFGDYKKAYYRECLQYINNRYQDGDKVYMYWNMNVPYQFYRKHQGLKFTAVEGSDVRLTAGSTADYFAKLGPDLEALDGAKRVWVIYSKYHVIEIGDIDRHPNWYFEDVKGGNKLHKEFEKIGDEVSSHEVRDLKISLFDLSE